MGRRVVGLITVLLLAGCSPSPVIDAAPEAPAYDGPLYVPDATDPTDQQADHSGAAGRVVDCDGDHVGYSEPFPYGGGVDADPLQTLGRVARAYLADEATGYRAVRREPDRILYTFEFDRRNRVAVIVRRGAGGEGATGWYPESWARCDWFELPASWAEERGLQLWTEGSGQRVASTTISSGAGPEHCDWQDMTFLSLDGGSLGGGRSFVAHPHPDLYPDWFTVPYAEGRPLPSDARDTGWDRDGRHLWLAPDDSRAYVGTRGAVDVWPAEVQPMGCA